MASWLGGSAKQRRVASGWFTGYTLERAIVSAVNTWRASLPILIGPELVWTLLLFPVHGLIWHPLLLVFLAGPGAAAYLGGLVLVYRAQPMPFTSRAEAIWNFCDTVHGLFLVFSFVSCWVISLITVACTTSRIWSHIGFLTGFAAVVAILNCWTALATEENVCCFQSSDRTPTLENFKRKTERIVRRGCAKGIVYFSVFYVISTILGRLPLEVSQPFIWLVPATVGWLDSLWMNLLHAGVVSMVMWELARAVYEANVAPLSFTLNIRDGRVENDMPELITSLEMSSNPMQQYLAYQQLHAIAWKPRFANERAQLFRPHLLKVLYDQSALVRAFQSCIGAVIGQSELLELRLGGGPRAFPALSGGAPAKPRELSLLTLLGMLWDNYMGPVSGWRMMVSQFLVRETHTIQPKFGKAACFPDNRPTSSSSQPTAVASSDTRPASFTKPPGAPASASFASTHGSAPAQVPTRGAPWEYLRLYANQTRERLADVLKGLSVFNFLFGEQTKFCVRVALVDWQLVVWAAGAMAGLLGRMTEDTQRIMVSYKLHEEAAHAMEACYRVIERQYNSANWEAVELYHGLEIRNALLQAMEYIHRTYPDLAFAMDIKMELAKLKALKSVELYQKPNTCTAT